MAFNHHEADCDTFVFRAPNEYVGPIRQCLLKLQAGLELSHNDMVFFKMAIDLAEIEAEAMHPERKLTAKNLELCLRADKKIVEERYQALEQLRANRG